jgi:hypothetical protein
VLTLACGSVSIEPDHDSAGHNIIADPWGCLEQRERRGKVRANDAELHARVIAYIAGAEAERAILGRCRGGDGDDQCQIDSMADALSPGTKWSKFGPRLTAMTRMLVRRHRALIERVAKALLASPTMSGAELDRLIGRSVDEVKVNAPLLLALQASDADEGQPIEITWLP